MQKNAKMRPEENMKLEKLKTTNLPLQLTFTRIWSSNTQRMPTITITWKFQTHRVNVNGMTVLQEILNESIGYFKLSKPSTRKYKFLSSTNKEVDLSTPCRFLNLAHGAKLELVEADEEEEESTVVENVNIRCSLNIQESSSVVTKKFPNDTTIKDMIDEFLKEVAGKDAKYETDQLSVQIMMKRLAVSEWDKQLRDVGLLVGNHAIRLVILDASKFKSVEMMQVPVQTPTHAKMPQEQSGQKDYQQAHAGRGHEGVSSALLSSSITVDAIVPGGKPADDGAVGGDEDPDWVYEMDVSQAKRYQQLLARRARPADEPLLTRALREKRQQEKLPALSVMRMFLPSGHSVRISMGSDLTLADLAQVLRERVLPADVAQGRFELVEGDLHRKGPVVFSSDVTVQQLRAQTLQSVGLGGGVRASLLIVYEVRKN